MSKLDELFERKLADHTIAPSSGAWKNVESRLSKNNKTVIWMRWAAAFLFGSLLFSLLWIGNRETSLPVANETPLAQPKIKIDLVPLVTEVKKESNPVDKQKNKEIHQLNQRVQPTSAAIHASSVKEEITEEPIHVAEVQNFNSLEIIKHAETPKSMVLTFTLDPVEFSQAENTGEKVAATEEKKDKSFRRMMKAANKMKNSESPLGEIRNMKEELFALDFKSKTTNKKH